MFHVYFALSELAYVAFRERQPARVDAGWRELHDHAGRALDAARAHHGEIACGLLSAYCASEPAFIARFVEFADRALGRTPLDEDPGAVKEITVKLALALNPPGAVPVVCRFIRSGARVSARMKAVRDICGYAPHYPEVREVLGWVVAEDPWLRDRAQHCLDRMAAPTGGP